MSGGADPDLVLHASPDTPVGGFVDALPDRFELVDHVTYPGMSGFLPVSVYVFEDRAATGGS
jgi:hypothetical protein